MIAERNRFDQWIEALYQRHKGHYFWLLIATTVAIVHFVLGPVFFGLLGPLMTQDIDRWPRILALAEVGLLFGSILCTYVVRSHHVALIRHCHGDETVDAEEIWIASVARLPQSSFKGLLCYLLPVLSVVYVIGVSENNSVEAHIAVALAFGVATLSSGAFMHLVWEIALRPVVREIAPRLPDDLVLRNQGLSLARRLLFLLVTLSLLNGVAVGASGFNGLDRDTRMLVVVGTAILLSATLAGALVLLIEHSFVTRIEELSRALQSLSGGGGLGTRLPPLAGDDLDEAGHAFNEMVVRMAQHHEEMQASRARIVTVAVDERRRMERDIHDGAQQHLALLNLQLSVLRRSAADYPDLTPKFDEMRASIADALTEMRNLAHGIYPAALETDGLAAALDEASSRAGLPTSLELEDVGRLSREVEAAVYFCCLEALQNATKHAGLGARATIALAERDGALNFSVTDDGVGFDITSDSHGLENMRDRIGALGGEVFIASAPGCGVTVSGSVPLMVPAPTQ